MSGFPGTFAAAEVSVDGLHGDDVTEQLRRTFASPAYRPPMLPEVAIEVMRLAQLPEVRFEEVVALLQKDPVLAARVLSIANSAAYTTRSPITTLQQASVRLGLETMRDLVLEAALHLKVFRAPGYDEAMKRLGRHSAAVAHVMRAVCRRTNVEAEYAFLCGLLHDVGFAAALLALSADRSWRGSSFEVLKPVLDDVHEEASGLLTRLWKLPEGIQRMVSTHHDPAPGGRIELVNASLIVAEQLVWEAGAGMEPPPPGAVAMSMETPDAPVDGVDVNWSGVVLEARKALRMDELGMAAARVEAFLLVGALGA
jgi:HD-like signal output (HDOD) protein